MTVDLSPARRARAARERRAVTACTATGLAALTGTGLVAHLVVNPAVSPVALGLAGVAGGLGVAAWGLFRGTRNRGVDSRPTPM